MLEAYQDGVLSSQRSQLIADLEQTVTLFTFADLSQAVATVESLVQEHAKSSVRKMLDHALVASPRAEVRRLYLAPTVVSAGMDLRDAQMLVISITTSRDLQTPDPVIRTCTLTGYGRISRVSVLVPEALGDVATVASEICAALVESAYAWLEAAVDAFVGRAEVNIASEMYRFVRSVFPNDRANENLWFACLHERFGFRLVDPKVATAAFDLIEEHAPLYGGTTLQFVTELLRTRLPREQLLMQRSHALGTVLQVDVGDAGYSDGASLYPQVLASLYGSSAFTICPVYVSELTTILALFPTGAPAIVERLRQHEKELRSLAENVVRRLDEYAALFEPPTGFDNRLPSFAIPPPRSEYVVVGHSRDRIELELHELEGRIERGIEAREKASRSIPVREGSHRARTLSLLHEALREVRALRAIATLAGGDPQLVREAEQRLKAVRSQIDQIR